MREIDQELFSATTIGDIHKVRAAITKGADVNANDDGDTPLHMAVMCRCENVVDFLMEHGANVDAKAADGKTPLHYAAIDGLVDIAKALIVRGADVNQKEEYGRTPLHLAAGFGCEDVAKLLIERGADMNVKDLWGFRPLHEAARHGHSYVAKVLIEMGADVHAKNSAGNPPADVMNCNVDVHVILAMVEAERLAKIAGVADSERFAARSVAI